MTKQVRADGVEISKVLFEREGETERPLIIIEHPIDLSSFLSLKVIDQVPSLTLEQLERGLLQKKVHNVSVIHHFKKTDIDRLISILNKKSPTIELVLEVDEVVNLEDSAWRKLRPFVNRIETESLSCKLITTKN